MTFFYVLSVILIISSFLIYKKTDKKLCLVSMIIYAIGLLFCYNTFIVYFVHLLKIEGSLLLFSLINYGISGIVLLVSFKEKKIQEYYFDKKRIAVIGCLCFLIFIIGCCKYRGFNDISFDSVDAAVHFRHAQHFSRNMSFLTDENSQDMVLGSFGRVMPLSYINCGILFKVFEGIDQYKVFLYYNVGFFILIAGIFMITILDMFRDDKKKYKHSLMISLIYLLAFPLNNFSMGFCYFSLCIMVLNLLFLTIMSFKNDMNKKILFKIIVIFLLTFGVFYGYYLFVPAIYLALGLYYIYLWKKLEINFKELLLYGGVTLIIPFVMGCLFFIIPWVSSSGVEGVTTLISLWGHCYDNITPIYLFVFGSVYLIVRNKINKIDGADDNYLKISLYVLSGYIILFFIYYILAGADEYYLYKLFSGYWLMIIIYFFRDIIKYKKVIYTIFIILCIVNVLCYFNGDNKFFNVLKKTNIYTWNVYTFTDDRTMFTKDELEILEESKKYKDECMENNRFLMVGQRRKNMWFYVLTEMIPIPQVVEGNYTEMYKYYIESFDEWDKRYNSYRCAIYYNETGKKEIDLTKFEVLYENKAGKIVKRLGNNSN